MIRHIQINNLKSLKKISIPADHLNLFFGLNGMGKSSVIQSLLLLRQSFWMNGKTSAAPLHTNGGLVQLGSVRDVFSQNAENDHMLIALQEDGIILKYEYCYNSDHAFDDVMNGKSDSCSREIPLFGDSFTYLGAEHIGPQKSYSLENWKASGINPLGNNGRYAVPYLASAGLNETVPEKLRHESAHSKYLLDQVTAWMKEISPGIRIEAQLLQAEQIARVYFSYEGERLVSDNYSPVNVGFGIPYVLPVITALLTSGPDSLIILENPESHLHPRGQAILAELIARAAANGAQIFCESHSDHIINGIRVAVRKGMIEHSDVVVTYFDKTADQNTTATVIDMDQNGNLSSYPEGLLDEWGFLMGELI